MIKITQDPEGRFEVRRFLEKGDTTGQVTQVWASLKDLHNHYSAQVDEAMEVFDAIEEFKLLQ